MSLNNFHIDKKQQIITLTDAYIDKLFNYKLTDYKFINSKKNRLFFRLLLATGRKYSMGISWWIQQW